MFRFRIAWRHNVRLILIVAAGWIAVHVHHPPFPEAIAGSVAKFFTSRTLTGQQNSPLSDGAMVEVTDDKSPSSPRLLTAKIFRITNAKHED